MRVRVPPRVLQLCCSLHCLLLSIPSHLTPLLLNPNVMEPPLSPSPLPSLPKLQSCCSCAVSAEQQLRNVGKGRGRGGGGAAAGAGERRPPDPRNTNTQAHRATNTDTPPPLLHRQLLWQAMCCQLFKAGPKQVKYILASANLEATVSSTGGMAQRQRV